MASSEQYAEWIVANQDKKGSPDFEKVANAYRITRITGERKEIEDGLLASIPKFYSPLDVGEAALSMGTGALGGLVGSVAGVGRTLTSGKFGTQEGIREGIKTGRDVSEAMTYRPRREGAQDITQSIGKAISASKIAGLGPSEAIPLATLAGPAIQQVKGMRGTPVPVPAAGQPVNVGMGAGDAREAALMVKRAGTPGTQQATRGYQRVPVPEADDLVGVGAAATPLPTIRAERAASLPVPIKLTKGQATRSFADQQFERETAKNATIGEPLRVRFAQQNKAIPQNLEFFADETGAVAGDLRSTGKIVTEAITKKAVTRKDQINAAYEAARKAGETQAPVNVAPLTAYLESKRPQAINAGVISSTLGDIQATTKKTGGVISINDLEEIRKGVGVAGGKDATNAHFAREIKDIIDNITDGIGGEKYKYARRLRAQYAREFENVGIIDRLLSTKPGTLDRSVAFEDVFDRAIMRGSLDDVRAVRRTLQTAGAEGQQAWRELQGQTLNHLKEEITKNAQRDIYGNPVVSAAQFNKIVTGLDKDGRLDFIFGKQGAQKIRDVRDISLDVLTSPPGSVNTSNTASVLAAMLDTVLMMTTGVPAPIATIGKLGIGAIKEAKQTRAVQEALNPRGILREP